MDVLEASRVVDRPLSQLAPVFAHPRLPDASQRTLNRCLGVVPSCISRCIIGVAYDVVPEGVQTVRDVMARQTLLLVVICLESRSSQDMLEESAGD